MPLPRVLRAVLVAAVAVMFAGGLAGCGGGDTKPVKVDPPVKSVEELPKTEREYVTEVNRVQRQFSAGAGKLNLANPDSAQAFASSLKQLDRLLADAAAQLAELTPPKPLAGQHRILVESMRGYRAQLDRHRGGLLSSDQRKVRDAATEIGAASTRFSGRFEDALSEINTRLGR